jgi:2-keto-4-pentenoate hydratase/2-oxohepta-3-ene-1,7-dioic acid hydratase in catechol pathway
MRYALATLGVNGRSVPAIEVGGKFWDLGTTSLASKVGPERRGLMGLFDDWEASHGKLKLLADDLSAGKAGPALTSYADKPVFQTPLQYPAKVFCTGTNYWDHIKEASMTIDKATKDTPYFFKPPTTALVGCGKSVRYPEQTKQFDWEIEMVAVIGKKASKVSVDKALDYVAGYANGCDLSARDWQTKTGVIRGKAFDDAAPVGPIILPAEFAGDPQDQRLVLKRNGKVEQDANTSGMVWSVAEQVSDISTHITLEPGDMILTGTPAGVGLFQNVFLKRGDKITCEIGRLGVLDFEII